MEQPRTSPLKIAALLVAAGLLVGSLVAAVSVGTASPFCPGGLGGEECRGLIVTLARRAGLVAGGATVVMILLAAGLVRMLAQDDRDRAEQAMEAYRSRREALSEK
ncbi:MAG: hypothetical protein ACRDJP_11390 [Actinomycetota bacterium]